MKYLSNQNNRRKHQRFYQSKDWKQLRNLKIRENPLCEHCLPQILTPASEIDHIISISKRWDLRLDYGNTQALCKSCHSRKTMAESRAELNPGAAPDAMAESLKGLIK